MPAAKTTVVTFASDKFNTTVSKESYINPECYGDDLCQWMISELSAKGIKCSEEPGQEDFGWYFRFSVKDKEHTFLCGGGPAEEDVPACWTVWIERATGLIGALFGKANKDIELDAVTLVHEALKSSPEISKIKWHQKADLERGKEENGVENPC